MAAQVMFWDVRLDRLAKKGAGPGKRSAGAADDLELVWRPLHVVHLLSVAGGVG
jgi:hypothetical protein